MFFSLSIFYLYLLTILTLTMPPRANEKHDNGARSTPSSEIMPKHDEDSGGMGKKYIVG